MMSQGSGLRTTTLALFAGAMAVAAPLSASAQPMSEHCLFLQERIARMQGDIVALQALVNQQYVFMKFTPKAGQSIDEATNAAYQFYFTRGTWFDAETKSIYIIVTQDFVREYAQSTGGGDAAVQKVLARNEGLRQKIQYGGVVESLRTNVVNWQQDFTRECGGQTPPPPPPDNGCLLGVCP